MSNDLQISFEFFPPKDEAAEEKLWQTVKRLEPLKPRFVSVTYGADGSTRDRTHKIVQRIQNETTLTGAPHLTCVGSTKEEILEIAQGYWDEGITNIVALRGDPPQGQDTYVPHPGGFAYANDLVEGLMELADFDLSVASYPEVHPEAPSADFDLDVLKKKIDAGAKRSITQFFFDTELFLRFRDAAAAKGIDAPLVPGILPITNFKSLKGFAGRCGAAVPEWLGQRFEGLDDDQETRQMIAANVAIEQAQLLQQEGVTEFHFYTLNRAELSYAICYALGARPAE